MKKWLNKVLGAQRKSETPSIDVTITQAAADAKIEPAEVDVEQTIAAPPIRDEQSIQLWRRRCR